MGHRTSQAGTTSGHRSTGAKILARKGGDGGYCAAIHAVDVRLAVIWLLFQFIAVLGSRIVHGDFNGGRPGAVADG
jgi:hypothetical protein